MAAATQTRKFEMTRYISVAILLAGFSIFSSSGFAQTQSELNETSAAAYKKADEVLNSTYKALAAKLDDEGKKKLQVAERAWVAFRDAECDSQTDDYRGGSIRPLIYSDCATHLTEARTADLKARLDLLNRR